MLDFIKEMTDQQREEFMDCMTISDQYHDYYKTHERPLTLKQSLLDYEAKRRVMA